jgi:large repetitive protein
MPSMSRGFRWMAPCALVLCACGGGGDPAPQPAGDTIAPDTFLDASPTPRTNATSLAFTVSSNEPGVTFEARADGGFFGVVPASFSLSGLAQGPHRIEIRCRDAAGNIDISPVIFDVVVDFTPPDTVISGGPPPSTSATTATFTFASENNASFEASLDGGPFTFAVTPLTLNGLTPGSHTLNVRAMDQAANLDPTPAAYSWIITP